MLGWVHADCCHTVFLVQSKLSPKWIEWYVSRFHGALVVFLYVCQFVMSVVHHEGSMMVWFFSKRLGLIAWFHESMSRRNPSSRSAFLLKSGGKTLLFFASCSTPVKGLYRLSRQNLCLSPKIYIMLKPKNFGTGEVTGIG